jgi:hypothetical protein
LPDVACYGRQTTASIFHAWKKERVDIGDVVVQVKLTVLTDPAKVTASHWWT